MRSVEDLTTVARIRDAAIEQFGQHGFSASVRSIATAAGVSAALVIHHFGSKEKLREACDAYVIETVRAAKTESMQNASPSAWFAQLAEIESFAPMTAYLMQALQTGGDLAKSLWQSMIDNAEGYLEEGVRAGTLKPSRDPKARARFLALTSGGALLTYIQLHPNPTDFRQVLHDYAQDMLLPSLELYTNGLMADPTMYEAFLAQREAGQPIVTTTEE
ncbi:MULTISPECIES: TetR/AcrR family transcriptional regulator [Mycobacteriaceae]|jgi:AcrR family transcriptional regulator|uniref:TetR/AcrR family transcriptional regulator n=1 Tax=Mycolicibacterium mucogenicum TaxID=56689 RepID=A0A4R5WNV0_MYCMU|nr:MULTISPECIES: TetR family transcriptional regulator [Mycolicibacterium]TDK93100.1 TetR/AcrR family transcriptional regulator [Mycolicibacterium mucogenicum]GCA97157.1 TetR family transcriptional regulator [Mycolicibacterium sp. NCC-Tsukiji]